VRRLQQAVTGLSADRHVRSVLLLLLGTFNAPRGDRPPRKQRATSVFDMNDVLTPCRGFIDTGDGFTLAVLFSIWAYVPHARTA